MLEKEPAFLQYRRSNMGRIFAVFLPVLAQCLRMFNASKPKTMDYKSMLIGGLATALLFVSIGAGTQQQTTNESHVPESHVWEFHLSDPAENRSGMAFSINKVTGEVRKYESKSSELLGFGNYKVTIKR